MRRAWWLLALAPACFSFQPLPGGVACSSDPARPCPDGYTCLAGACWPRGLSPDLALTDGAPDLAPPNNDLAAPPDHDLAVAPPDLAAAPPDLASPDLSTGWRTATFGSAPLIGLWGSSATDVFAVGGGGTILHATNGSSFTAQTSGTASVLTRAWGAGGVVYVVGLNTTVLSSSSDGASWQPVALPSSVVTAAPWFYGVWGSSASDFFLAGTQGTMLHTANGGATFTTQNSTSGRTLNNLWGSGAGDVFAVGNTATIVHTVDGGQNWQTQSVSTGVTNNLNGIGGTGAGDIYAVGDGGVILHTSDGGATWIAQTSGVLTNLRSVWGAGVDVYAVGENGFILHTGNRGAAWVPEASGTTALLYAVWGAGGNVFAAGDTGIVLRR